jgi:hypothetical protein
MPTHRWLTRATLAVTLALALAAAGCGDDETTPGTGEGSGSLSVLVEAEDVIIEGLVPGDGAENIKDGWTVSFDKYITTIGDIDIHLSTDDGVQAEAADVFVVDLKQAPPTGFALWTLEDLVEGRWDFNYATPGAGDGSARHDSVAQADYDAMVAADWTYLIEGVMTKSDGQSCPPAALAVPGDKVPNGNQSGGNDCYDAPTVRFSFGATAETSFGPCELDEVPGFAITADTTQTVAATLHGDHLFFNGFPEGDEGGTTRLAQWWADCDLDLDGNVTVEELQAIAPSALPELDDRYQLGGSPITPLDNMYTYVSAQLKTQGHMNGEGECAADGEAHEHD